MARIIVACPSYDGRMDAGCCRNLHQTGSKGLHDVLPVPNFSSLLTQNCNSLWCIALNLRKKDFDWFAMLHADVTPEEYWLDKMLVLAEEHRADFLSAVIPIKNKKGVTSTGLAHPTNPWLPGVRLTLQQINHPFFPEVFDCGGAVHALKRLPGEMRIDYPQTYLLANTGCMVCRLDRPWVTRVCFENRDRIYQKPDGDWIAQTQSEDWIFSKRIAEEGGTVKVTKKLMVDHRGPYNYSSKDTWGSAIDPDFKLCNSEK